MLQLLINASIIWCSSLLVYELLLKRETYHRLNRLYLLLTFVTGLVLPLLPWGQTVFVTSSSEAINSTPIPQLPPAGSTASILQPDTGLLTSGSNWWLLVYILGAIATILYLLRDLWRLRSLYKDATITAHKSWTIAETGQLHSPFSFLHIVFVSNRAQYTDTQWEMLLQHEQQHYRSRHILDLALIHLAIVMLWFHPLVYCYRLRLRQLHEYEVDSRQNTDLLSYGRFLLEQAAFPPPLVLTHSLSFSPLKNRIHMMTKKPSTRRTQYRLLLLLPMMSLFIWCCSKNRSEVKIDVKGRYAMAHDARIGYPKPKPADTVTFTTDSSAEPQMVVITLDPVPNKLGNQEILRPEELATAPKCVNPGAAFNINYLLDEANLTPMLQKMHDGVYFMAISDIIVDPTGQPVYYSITFPENHQDMSTDANGFNLAKPNGLTEQDEQEIQKKLSTVLLGGNIAFSPVTNKQGAKVPYFLEPYGKDSDFQLRTNLTVKNHKVSFSKPAS